MPRYARTMKVTVEGSAGRCDQIAKTHGLPMRRCPRVLNVCCSPSDLQNRSPMGCVRDPGSEAKLAARKRALYRVYRDIEGLGV